MSEVHVLRILDRTGDTAVEWRPGTIEEEKHAGEEFDRLTKLGYLMFRADAPGATREQIREFDPSALEIVAVAPFKGG